MMKMPETDPLDDAVIIALGCNLRGPYPSREALLEAAVARMAEEGLAVTGRSRWWRTPAWPDPGEPEYLNGVALVETALTPVKTMAALLRVETAFGRRREAGGPRNAPRTLDLDLIAFGRLTIEEPGLIVPHPRARMRGFVMGPLAEIAPTWRHPTTGEAAIELAQLA